MLVVNKINMRRRRERVAHKPEMGPFLNHRVMRLPVQNELWRKHGGAHMNVMQLCQLAAFGHF